MVLVDERQVVVHVRGEYEGQETFSPESIDGCRGGSEREVVCNSLGPAAVPGGRRVEAVLSEEVRAYRQDVGRADPRCPRLLGTYLLGDLIEGAPALGEVTT
jgi:hypothetical protein